MPNKIFSVLGRPGVVPEVPGQAPGRRPGRAVGVLPQRVVVRHEGIVVLSARCTARQQRQPCRQTHEDHKDHGAPGPVIHAPAGLMPTAHGPGTAQ